MLKGKKIILGVTGSIAAYKAAYLVRLLKKERAEVKVIMTPSSRDFITPLTLAVLSRNRIYCEPFNPESGKWYSHIDFGLWADLLLIAPVSANTIAKMAQGVADNFLLTTYLSARCPVMISPAMDMYMYNHPVTRENLDMLKKRGVHILESPEGELASGLEGAGRMMEPEEIVLELKSFLALHPKKRTKLAGKKIMITAGPTYEAIDPVRYIGNRSSGKMGIALAEKAVQMGADVTLILGPGTHGKIPHKVNVIPVVSAEEMYRESLKVFPGSDVAILAAAVADFTPVETSGQKIKRDKDKLVIQLKPTIDIAAELGKLKTNDQMLVGFALESENEVENALSKIRNKNLNYIVLNSLRDEGAGFGYDTNKITIIDKSGNQKEYPLKSKTEVAQDILHFIQQKFL
ncbi:MAG: bifunctional phosphopantothenoylcysteine decarboxylase/phosphopantothenate--cysteine ligase CoaBC [Bacteroidales bacterium]|nr:bifunctional phosphopantothenoylcysteine decarboxylase/phosphopantothenate--cysteine ligase CoaBC [Bacteroidales bacterium]